MGQNFKKTLALNLQQREREKNAASFRKSLSNLTPASTGSEQPPALHLYYPVSTVDL
jgi:hypothetical protein